MASISHTVMTVLDISIEPFLLWRVSGLRSWRKGLSKNWWSSGRIRIHGPLREAGKEQERCSVHPEKRWEH